MTPFLPRYDASASAPGTFTPSRSDDPVVELHLLLPLWQVEALEAAAQARGMTTGQVLRRVISNLLAEAHSPPSN